MCRCCRAKRGNRGLDRTKLGKGDEDRSDGQENDFVESYEGGEYEKWADVEELHSSYIPKARTPGKLMGYDCAGYCQHRGRGTVNRCSGSSVRFKTICAYGHRRRQ
jgi:hypothetical protein